MLTFALREALYGLAHVPRELCPARRADSLEAVMEDLNCAKPDHWQKYYRGEDAEQRIKRHFSYSDRIRYYWPQPEAARAVGQLLALLGETKIRAPLVRQYLTAAYPGVADGSVPATARALLSTAVRVVIGKYVAATLKHGLGRIPELAEPSRIRW